jgi:hypothetical protein
MKEFETKLKALVEEFYEPETGYAVEDTDMIQAEIEWEKELTKE